MQRAFKDWETRYNKYISNEFCHFNLNQEFLSLYSLEVNKAFGALLRLTEIDDLVRQFSHLSRKTLVGFPDLPRFLTSQLELRLSRFHSLSATVSALRAGFALMIEPVVSRFGNFFRVFYCTPALVSRPRFLLFLLSPFPFVFLFCSLSVQLVSFSSPVL